MVLKKFLPIEELKTRGQKKNQIEFNNVYTTIERMEFSDTF